MESTRTPIVSTANQQAIYGSDPQRRITMRDLQVATDKGQRWPMITAYDALSAGVFDDAGIPALLVGDSAGMVVFGHDTTISVSVDELVMLVRAVVTGSKRALVVADLPFGSYQASPAQALERAAPTRSNLKAAQRCSPRLSCSQIPESQ